MKRLLRWMFVPILALCLCFASVFLAEASNQLTLYAQYRTQVTFYANGGRFTGGATSAEQALVASGASSGSIPYAPGQQASTGLSGAKDGFLFIGWNTRADGLGTYMTDYGTINGPVSFYAIYYQTDFYQSGTYPSGSLQTFWAPWNGWYQIQCWGGSGQDAKAIGTNYYAHGGKGGYASGSVYLNAGTTLYVNVGYGGDVATTNWVNHNVNHVEGYGGGAADVRTNTSLESRFLVAGGGGAGAIYAGGTNPPGSVMGTVDGGVGGGLTGGNGVKLYNNMTWDAPAPTGGTQTSGGRGYSTGEHAGHDCNGRFGYRSAECVYGGDGWYGGGGNRTQSQMSSGGGGSGYAAGYPGCAGNSSGMSVSNPILQSGAEYIPAPGGGTELGHTGNGFVRIICTSR